MKICLYCFYTFVILEFLTIQVLSTLSLVLMTSNKVETTRVVAVETRNPYLWAVGTIVLAQCMWHYNQFGQHPRLTALKQDLADQGLVNGEFGLA
jgi:hypothetical protein